MLADLKGHVRPAKVDVVKTRYGFYGGLQSGWRGYVNNRIVCRIGLWEGVCGDYFAKQIGYECWYPGHGYMTACLILALPEIPTDYKTIVIAKSNEASQRVAEKAGFICALETLQRFVYKPKGTA